jgi:hypothetical protein
MINPDELAISGKKNREATERKKIVLELARKLNFESALFPKEFQFSSREPLRYYLWMRELELWLVNKYNLQWDTVFDVFLLENKLGNIMSLLIPNENDTRKK